jgi:hypothetical protein
MTPARGKRESDRPSFPAVARRARAGIAIKRNVPVGRFGEERDFDARCCGGPDYAAFIRGVNASCIVDQSKNPRNQTAGLTEQQISTYCACIAQATAQQLATEELAHYRNKNSFLASVQVKANRTVLACGRLAYEQRNAERSSDTKAGL